MRIAKGLLIGVVVAAIGVTCFWQFGCDKHPTKPEPPELKDYPVYFCNTLSPTLWAFHPTTRELDSIVLPFSGEVRGVTVSADGRLFYFSQSDRVLVYTSDSLRLVMDLQHSARWGTAVSSDDALLAIMGDSLFILRTSDWSEVHSDTLQVISGVFSSDSRTFYAAYGQSGELFNCVLWTNPLDSAPFLNCLNMPEPLLRVFPTSDNTKLVASLIFRFVVFDLSQDSIIYETVAGAGGLALTPDGQYAFFSTPGTPLEVPGTTDLYMFDVGTNQMCDTIKIDYLLDSLNIYTPGIGEMSITPDSRWLVGIGAPFQRYTLFLYDLKSRKAAFAYQFGANTDLTAPCVQRNR
jgi:hypothetical protein